MFRRMFLAFACVAALGAAGLGFASPAQAHGGRIYGPVGYGGFNNGYGYNVGYGGYPAGGYGNAGLRMVGFGPYGPVVPVYSGYPVNYGGPGYYGGGPSVSIRVRF